MASVSVTAVFRILAPYERFERAAEGSLDQRKKQLTIALANCNFTVAKATEQMRVLQDRMLLEDLMHMRAAAIAAIPLAEEAMRATSEDQFAHWLAQFILQYDHLVASVKAFVWDSRGNMRMLYTLVEEIM